MLCSVMLCYVIFIISRKKTHDIFFVVLFLKSSFLSISAISSACSYASNEADSFYACQKKRIYAFPKQASFSLASPCWKYSTVGNFPWSNLQEKHPPSVQVLPMYEM